MPAGVSSPRRWERPLSFDVSIAAEAELLGALEVSGRVKRVVDTTGFAFAEYKAIAEMSSWGDVDDTTGRWIFFPWSGDLVKYPPVEVHRRLRTARNAYLVTADEQELLGRATIAVFGLSVGSNVVERLAISGIGGSYVLADPDMIQATNLNRMRGSIADLGEGKVDHVAMWLSEIDPYIDQIHLRDGVTEGALSALLEGGSRPDVLIDEVDDLVAKMMIRVYARAHRVPVVMVTDVADSVLVDVERYDTDPRSEPFGGRLSSGQLAALSSGELSDRQRRQVLLKIIGVRNLNTRMVKSALDVDKRLAGVPQLGTTAGMAGSLGAIAVREILLGRPMRSGRYVVSARRALHLERSAPAAEALAALLKLLIPQRRSRAS